MKKSNFFNSQKKKLEGNKKTHNVIFQDIKRERNKDPLDSLYQMDDEKNIISKKEVGLLIKRLFYNIEEFYQLKYMIKEIMEKNEEDNMKNRYYFKNLLTEVRAVQFMNIYKR